MRRLAVLPVALVVGVLAPAAALANWSSTVFSGALTVSTATLADPTAVAAANNRYACRSRRANSLQVDLTWTPSTSPRATGYVVLRNGTQVGTVSGVASTSWSDTTGQLAFSTTYTYTVASSVGGWTSPGATASVRTYGSRCR